MKKMILRSFVFISLVLLSAACSVNTSINDPVVATPTPTPLAPTATPATGVGATISYGGSFNFSPSGVTVIHGQSVVWDSSFGSGSHNLTVDNFSGTSGTCSPSTNVTAFPVTQVFPATGIYYFHCGFHSGCAAGACGICSGGLGMVGFVQVN
jgi:plastocyanin